MNFKRNFFKFLSTERWKDSAIFFMRIFIGILMLSHGIAKINNYEMLYTSFPSIFGMGSTLSLILIIAAEVGGSLLLIIGLLVRPAAIALAFSMFVAAFIASAGTPFSARELPLIYMGIYIMLSISGGMRYSLDRVFFSKQGTLE